MASRHQPRHRRQPPARTLPRRGVVFSLGMAVVSCTALWTGSVDYAVSWGASPVRPGTAVDAVPTQQQEVGDARTSTVQAPPAGATTPRVDLTGMTLSELRSHAARLQARFTKGTIAWQAAEAAAEEADDEAFRAEQQAIQVEQRRQQAEDAYVDVVNERLAGGPGTVPLLTAVLSGPGTIGDVVADTALAELLADSQAAEHADLDSLATQAALVSEQAEEARAQAARSAADAERLLTTVQSAASKAAVAANEAVLAQAEHGVVADPRQERRNRQALRKWSRYLSTLEAAKVVPPDAAVLAEPGAASMPYGMDPVLDTSGDPVPGVARATHRSRTVPVLPRQTIAAVSAAFSRIGRPYAQDATGPARFGCAGLVSAAWRTTGLTLPASVVDLHAGTRVVEPATMQVGDLVFFSDPAVGLHHTGINLGNHLMLTADAVTYQVGVHEFPSAPHAVTRPSLGPASATRAVPAASDPGAMECGATSQAVSASGMQMPLREGTFTFSAQYGERGSLWSSEVHTGLDFAAPAGTAVYATKSGRVSLSEVGWAGTLVTIAHGDGVETRYAHMSTLLVDDGQRVELGQPIGGVGSRGNSTGPHLHLEVVVAGVPVDPMPYLLGDGAAVGGWGGYTNGMIPETALCTPVTAPPHLLRCDAANAFDALEAAYRARFGSSLCITDSYRSFAAQVDTFKRKPTLAAVPGTSNHGWGLAVDLCGGIESFSSPQHAWMVVNAPEHGWQLPEWARQSGSRPEPWHWEFGSVA